VTAALELLQIAIEEDHPLVAIGDPVPPFEGLIGTDGLRHSLRDYSGAEALVVIFSSNRCPTAKAYASRLRALQADYAPRGVQILLLNANAPHLYPDEAFEKMVERAAARLDRVDVRQIEHDHVGEPLPVVLVFDHGGHAEAFEERRDGIAGAGSTRRDPGDGTVRRRSPRAGRTGAGARERVEQ
jgi:hypothetical protein